MDEQKRKKISIIGSFLFHIFIFLFISITGLLKFTTLPQYDEIVEITSVSGSGGGSASANITDSTYTPPLEPAPVEQAPITPDSILQHSDIATTNVTYEQIQELQEKVEKHEITTEEAVIAPPINNNVEHSNHHNGNNATINTNDDTGSGNGAGTDSGSSEGTGDGESSGSGSGSGVGDSDGNDDNDDNVYSNPAIPPRIIKSPTPKYPILFSHHMMAYFSMLSRDFSRFKGVYERCDIMPLGAGALAGTTFPIDREFVAKQLNFDAIYANSLDAVSDRDYIMEFLSAASILMIHLSRISEEIIFWCSREFSFVELDDAHCTGSSMMPQKKNPDVSELVRGKTGRVIGHLMAMLTTVKGLPLAYNKDLQEDKEGLFDAIDTIKFSLAVYAQLIRGMKVRKDVMLKAVREDFSNATDLADYLVKKGMPFRKAHSVSGHAVHYCIEHNKWLEDLTMDEFKQMSDLFDEDIYEAITPETCVKTRNSYGGTSYSQVDMQLKLADKILSQEQTQLNIGL